MYNEPDDDHEGEEDVERKGNGKVWKGGRHNKDWDRPRAPIDEKYTHRCVDDVSPELYRRFVDNSNTHPMNQGT